MYEVFEHTADLGLRVRAADLESLFAEAALALFATVVDLAEVRLTQQETFRIEGGDHEYLLFDWLNELLFAWEGRRLLFADFQVRIDDEGLTAEARGEPLELERHRLDHEVKAITYHGLKVEQQGDQWLAEVIVDI